jgi:hypothetical protein
MPRGSIDVFSEQYAAACAHTAEESRFGLTREAAALAKQIRWNPDRLAEFDYPNGMDMATTCCCHIVVDDENTADGHVAFCIQQAARKEHPDCLRLALLLARASHTQRRKIHILAWD